MALVYDAGWQGKKVRAVIWCLLGVGVLFCWLGTLRPEVPPPPELAESTADWFIATLLAFGVGIVVPAAMLVYGRCYIGRVEVDDDGTVRIHHIGLFGSPERVLRPGDIVPGGEYHDGRFDTYKHSVNAPWFTVRVRGRRLPLILDPQGDVIDAGRAERALGLEPDSLTPWSMDDDAPLPSSTRNPRPARGKGE